MEIKTKTVMANQIKDGLSISARDYIIPDSMEKVMQTELEDLVFENEKPIVKHFKGALYKVLNIAIHTETKEKLVIYQGKDDASSTYARPLNSFFNIVDVEGIDTFRFDFTDKPQWLREMLHQY